jgi:hypothetical protein
VTEPFLLFLAPDAIDRQFTAPEPEDVDFILDLGDGEVSIPQFDRAYLDRIPPEEADAIELAMRGCHQHDLAKIFGVSQAAISYRRLRGIERIRYMVWLDSLEITEERLRADLTKLGVGEIWGKGWHLVHDQIEIIVGIWSTSCATIVAQALGINGTAALNGWHRFGAMLAENSDPHFDRYRSWYRRHKWNVLRQSAVAQTWAARKAEGKLRARPAPFYVAKLGREERIALRVIRANPGIAGVVVRNATGLDRARWYRLSRRLEKSGLIRSVRGPRFTQRFWGY